MIGEKDKIPYEVARDAVRTVAKRIALLHMCYARTLVHEFGQDKGTDLIKEAIWAYGTLIGEQTRARVENLDLAATPENFGQGSDLSPIGFEDHKVTVKGEQRSRSINCVLAEVWQEYGEEELGKLYCLVDPAKMHAYNPDWTMEHTLRILNGDPCCEIAVRPTSSENS